MKANRKILYIITHMEMGGAQKHLLSLLDGLQGKNFEIHVVCGEKGYLKNDLLNYERIKVEVIPQLVREINPVFDAIAFLKIYWYIKKNHFDIVHTHSPKASFLGRWAGYCAGVRNIFYTVHGWPFHKFMHPMSYFLYWFLEKVTAFITNRIIVVSCADFTMGVASKIAPSRKLKIIHYGIDVKRFNDVFNWRIKDGACDNKTIVTVSSFKPQKNMFAFLKVCLELVNLGLVKKIIILGDGPLKPKVTKQVDILGLNPYTVLTGWVNDISPYLRNASVFILTSLWEGLPFAVMEAVVSGVPVVVTDTGGVRDIMSENVQGIIVNPRKKSEFVNACVDVLKNNDRWDRIIKENRMTMDCSYWTQERMINDIESLYTIT